MVKYRIIEKDCKDHRGDRDRRFFVQKKFLFMWFDYGTSKYNLEGAKKALDYYILKDKINSTKTPSVVHEEV